ncbi:MAG: glycosyltransferase family 39 protein [Acidobacteriota bacterium]
MRARTGLQGSQWVLLLSVLILAACLRIYRLGAENFWIDELNQIQVASQSPLEIIRNYRPGAERMLQGRWSLRTWDQAPLSILISHLFLSHENREFWARFPSFLFGCLGVVAIFLFARRYVSFQTALLSMFLLAISPLDIWYSQEARWYTQWSLLTTLSYLALATAERSGKVRHWATYAALVVASIYTFLYAFCLLFAQAMSQLWRARRSLSDRRVLAAFACVVVLILTLTVPVTRMILGNLETANSGTPRSSSLLELPYTFLTFSTGFTIGPSLADLHAPLGLGTILTRYPALILVFLVFGSVALAGSVQLLSRPDLGSWLWPWLLIPITSVFLVAAIIPDMTYQVRYSFAALPAFCLLLAIGLESVTSRLRWLAIASVILLSAFSLWHLYSNSYYDKADVRGAIAHVKSNCPGGCQLAVVGQVVMAIPFYGDQPDLQVVLGCGSKDGLRDPVDSTRDVWLLVGRDWKSEGEPCRQLLTETHVESRAAKLPGIEIWKFEPRVR